MNRTDIEDLLLKGNLNLLPATFINDRDARIISKVMRLMPWRDEDLGVTILRSLLRLPREFKKIRREAHLRRLICAEFFYKRKVMQAIDRYPHKRHLFVKFLKTRLEFPFGTKPVLGMVIAFNLLKHREAVEEGHILESVRHVISGVSVVKGSFVDYQDRQNQVHEVYLEIEREDQPEFSLEEIKRLQETLPMELKGCVEELVPVTFMRRNEEEVYRNILALRDQLKSVKDIPQTTITFEEQTQFDLFFTVVLLRIIKGNVPSIQEILTKEDPDIIFIPDRVDLVGTLRTQYKKEATVFRLQLPKSQFFRKDRSVNLYKARQRVLAMLIQALGPVRDYNGGLILKQNERLEDFLELTPKLYDVFFQENFFYSITPIAMQSILPAPLVKEWFLAFSELLERELSQKETYFLSCIHSEEAQLVLVRAEDSSFKELLIKEVGRLGIPSLELAYSEINMHGAYCFGFLYRPSQMGEEGRLCEIVRETMEKWSTTVGEDHVLRIAVHANEPSLDPRISKGDKSYILIKMLFEGLTRIGLDGKPELAIAESYKVSPDFKTYTFFLRESKWSNGAPITAYDFEYTWKKSLNPQVPFLFAQTLFLIKNARLAKENMVPLEEVGVTALDETTLVVELEHPAPYFLEVVAHWTYSLINRAIDQKYPGWAYHAGETYVCNGPFKLVEWKHSRAITMEKNPNYWDAEQVNFKKISITMLERGHTHLGPLVRGEVDLLGRPLGAFPVGGLGHLSEEVERVIYPINGLLLICFNTYQFPFNHKKIRQAFGCAIDRAAFRSAMPHEFVEESRSLLPKSLSLHADPIFPAQDIRQARALFFEGLGEIGFVKSDFPRITLQYYGGDLQLPILKLLCQQWKEAFGIEIHLKSVDWDNHVERLVKGKYQIGALELNARWDDPLHILEFFENRRDALNVAHWEHPGFQNILDLARRAPSFEERNRLLEDAEVFLGEHMPAIPLYELSGTYLKQAGLKNVLTLPSLQIDFKWAYKVS